MFRVRVVDIGQMKSGCGAMLVLCCVGVHFVGEVDWLGGWCFLGLDLIVLLLWVGSVF